MLRLKKDNGTYERWCFQNRDNLVDLYVHMKKVSITEGYEHLFYNVKFDDFVKLIFDSL